ncbi:MULTISPECIES: hypothetical protein [unclassified Streptomyces]|uniref:hypothetical protein n=1 Tax=unclassified Streptomyces TaxID=2593676 RepID=UPI002E1CD502|nr:MULTISPECIES: hypothetical protein [unclassified Streptomyces]
MIELYEEGVTVAAPLPHLGDEGAYGIPPARGATGLSALRMLHDGRPSEGPRSPRPGTSHIRA